jgi:RND family efflux transporter MFP subunit
MKMKSFVIIVLLASASIGGYFLGRSKSQNHGSAATTKEKTLYTCGMHPQVIQDHPGNCPICGMKLTPIKRSTGGATTTSSSGERKIKYWRAPMDPTYISDKPGKSPMGMDLVPVYEDEAASVNSATIAIDPVTIQDMDIRTGVVKRGPLRRVIRTVAVIDYNETGLADVTTKFQGWVEKLYVDTTGQQVHRGDPLFAIYSPELYSAQVEYLLALKAARNSADAGTEALKTSARQKLKYWDISDEQIAEIEKTGEPKKTLQVLAPIDGFVTEKDVVEGQMVKAGMKIYRLADLGLVWVQAEIYEQDLPYIKLGQEATMTLSYLPDRKFRGRVTYIYPYLDEKTRTVHVRIEFHNPGYFLKPGMFATVEVHAELSPSALLLPASAVLRSGQQNTVFVALEGGRFDPRTVVLGPRAEDDMYQVLSGVQEGERIVTSGQFMLDSESQLREAIQKMTEPGKESKMAMPMPSETNETTSVTATSQSPEQVVYVCPMPEHVSIEYDHPGKCPICGMTLVPVTKSVLKEIQPGGKVLYYTCPMPGHSDVRSDKPGKCPRCGMTLIPVMEQPKPPAETKSEPAASSEKSDSAPLVLYTRPMASDADVVSDKPGKCPKCDMDLVPTSTVKHGKIAEAIWHKEHPASQPSNAAPQPQH